MSPAAPQVWVRQPRVREMTQRQMECVLARNQVARVAFMSDGRLELRPVHYVLVHGALYGRTSFGAKAQAWLGGREVVLEVDEVDAVFDWRSIIVRGTISLLRPRGSARERAEYWKAIEAVRSLVPGAMTERDPAPHRPLVFRLVPVEVTGRESSS
jgi:nitroimidazol reductase NimA-like FMN-containing flavoprotein (pyridoxamine 5'-phosphate oxidase superfamily)